MPDHPTEEPRSDDEPSRVVPFPVRFTPELEEPQPLSPEEKARIEQMVEDTVAPLQEELRRTIANIEAARRLPLPIGPARPPCASLSEELERALGGIARGRGREGGSI